MKLALLCYHKNIDKIYPKAWIEKYKNSILNQTVKDFDIIEVDYGGSNQRIFENSCYLSKDFLNFVSCMNYLLDDCFNQGYDYVFNTNVDDYYSIDRIERQLLYLQRGFDVVSSNFVLIKDDKEFKSLLFHHMNIKNELSKNHNIIAHPVVAYSKQFWKHHKYDADQIPTEDLNLWQRAIDNKKFMILPDYLLFHRLHDNSVCQSQNR